MKYFCYHDLVLYTNIFSVNTYAIEQEYSVKLHTCLLQGKNSLSFPGQ